MATKTQKPEGAAAPELVPIDKLREPAQGRACHLCGRMRREWLAAR